MITGPAPVYESNSTGDREFGSESPSDEPAQNRQIEHLRTAVNATYGPQNAELPHIMDSVISHSNDLGEGAQW